jgi:hypothetical protein
MLVAMGPLQSRSRSRHGLPFRCVLAGTRNHFRSIRVTCMMRARLTFSDAGSADDLAEANGRVF